MSESWTGRWLLASRLVRFGLRVARSFLARRGILLAGGVGYNVLLSIVPLFALAAVLLAHIVDQQRLLLVMGAQAQLLAPAHADLLLEAVRSFLESRDLIGVVSTVVLLFFSSLAFRMLEDAMAVVFSGLPVPRQRTFLMSALLPYIYVLMLSIGLFALTLVSMLFDPLNGHSIHFLGWWVPLGQAQLIALYWLGFIGVGFLFASIYKVLPVARIHFHHALIGGFIAAALWEVVRLIMVYYFANISLVDAVYGSIATIIIVLLGLEVSAVILLLGAQVIAELEWCSLDGVPWHVTPRKIHVGNPWLTSTGEEEPGAGGARREEGETK